MRVLGIESSSLVASVALVTDDIMTAEYTVDFKKTHSQTLLPMLDEIVKLLDLDLDTIDAIAVAGGPGSFTGLRIGLATAEAMAYSWQCCLHGVDTLKALAYNIQLEGRVLSPVLDAQKGNFYQALYEWRNGELVELAPVEVVSAEKALERIALQGTPALLLGECSKLAKNGLPDFISVAPEALRMPKGSSVALAALAEFDAENDKKIFGLEPYYIRRSEAEELWEKKHKQQ